MNKIECLSFCVFLLLCEYFFLATKIFDLRTQTSSGAVCKTMLNLRFSSMLLHACEASKHFLCERCNVKLFLTTKEQQCNSYITTQCCLRNMLSLRIQLKYKVNGALVPKLTNNNAMSRAGCTAWFAYCARA